MAETPFMIASSLDSGNLFQRKPHFWHLHSAYQKMHQKATLEDFRLIKLLLSSKSTLAKESGGQKKENQHQQKVFKG
ncbi:MAG: hypothetical protein EAY75_14965 [Bacteroidetes bacterium]|nr:MAG: hypothetical protein EAY75_14965 [Bacteroidota bacterium]